MNSVSTQFHRISSSRRNGTTCFGSLYFAQGRYNKESFSEETHTMFNHTKCEKSETLCLWHSVFGRLHQLMDLVITRWFLKSGVTFTPFTLAHVKRECKDD